MLLMFNLGGVLQNQPSLLCTWELPIWSTSSIKTKPRTRDTPMQAWSCSWPWSWLPLPARAAAPSFFGSDASMTPTWLLLWWPVETGVRRKQGESGGLLQDKHADKVIQILIPETTQSGDHHKYILKPFPAQLLSGRLNNPKPIFVFAYVCYVTEKGNLSCLKSMLNFALFE